MTDAPMAEETGVITHAAPVAVGITGAVPVSSPSRVAVACGRPNGLSLTW